MQSFLGIELNEPSFKPETAWLEHGIFAMLLVKKLRPRRIVELGTHWGYSYFAMCEAVAAAGLDTECFAVDTWEGDFHAGYYDDSVFDTVQTENRKYAAFSTLLRKTFDEALADIGDGSVDLLHIDGRHLYEDVKYDHETWTPKLSDRAVVLFHDTMVHERDFGVHRYWAELTDQYPSFNFVHGHGLGVLLYGENQANEMRELLSLSGSKDGPGVVEDFFQLAGGIMSERVHMRARSAALEAETAKAQSSLDEASQNLQAVEAELEAATATLDLEREHTDRLQRDFQEAITIARKTEKAVKADLEARTALLDHERARAARLQRDLQEANSAAQRIADKAAKAERHPFRTLLRRLGYGGAKAALSVPGIRKSPAGPKIQKLVRKHSPKRFGEMLSSPAVLPRNATALVFRPDKQDDGEAVIATEAGSYAFTKDVGKYTYVPPAPPQDLSDRIRRMTTRPRFTVVMPTYNTPPTLLRKAIASVEAQWYPDWELLIVDDLSSERTTTAVLESLRDDRIEVVLRETNGGISAATNTAVERAQGDYVVFLDHDDELTEDCLWELAQEIDRTGADFIYSDEDKIDAAGHFVQPFFKPDWSPDTLMSTMYTCHVSCVQTNLLRSAGPLKTEYDGAQDWDLILRVTEKAKLIRHIPKILYHWRIIPGSTASDLNEKPKASVRAKLLREDALQRRGISGKLEELEIAPNYHRINYHPPADTRLSVIIPTRDNGTVLKSCVHSIVEARAWDDIEFVVVDNGSVDHTTLEIMHSLKRDISNLHVYRYDAPFNFSELQNIGLGYSSGNMILHLNDDTEIVARDAFRRMIGFACLSHIGAVGARLLYPGEKYVQHAGVLNFADGPIHAFHRTKDSSVYFNLRNHLEYNWLAVTGAALMIERSKLEEIGGWDENLPVAYNDVELCFRLYKAGYHNIVSQASTMIHHESISRGHDTSTEKAHRLKSDKRRLYDKHPDLFMHDPYFNPNLHPRGANFQLPEGRSS